MRNYTGRGGSWSESDTLYNCNSEQLKATWSVYKETSMVKKERHASGEDEDNTYCINFGDIVAHTLWSNASLLKIKLKWQTFASVMYTSSNFHHESYLKDPPDPWHCLQYFTRKGCFWQLKISCSDTNKASKYCFFLLLIISELFIFLETSMYMNTRLCSNSSQLPWQHSLYLGARGKK